jgi:peptidyl-prolyl cis-trans isomerase C
MNRDIAVALIGILAVAGLTYGVNATVTQPPMSPSRPHVAGEKPVVAAERPKDTSRVLMRVNGQPVTEADLQRLVEQIPEQQRAMVNSPEGQQMLAEDLVQQKVLEQKGREMGLDQDPDVQRQMGALENRVIAMKALEKLATPSEAEMRAEYAKLADVSMILIAHQGGQMPPRAGQPPTVEQALAKANGVVARARAGADFAQLAKTESDEPQTGQRGGLLGTVMPSDLAQQLGPEVSAAVGKLGDGQVSDPVRTPFGIAIFRSVKAKGRPFEEVRPMLEQRMRQERAATALAAEMRKAKVEREVPPAAAPPAMPGQTAPPAMRKTPS